MIKSQAGIVALLLVLGACSLPLGTRSASLHLSVSYPSRTIEAVGVAGALDHYAATLTPASGTVVNLDNLAATDTVAVTVGSWTIAVQAFDAAANVIGEGSSTITVLPGSNDVTVTVQPVQTSAGTGTFQVDFGWVEFPDSLSYSLRPWSTTDKDDANVVGASIGSNGNTAIDPLTYGYLTNGSITVNFNSHSATLGGTLKSGTYLLTLKLTQSVTTLATATQILQVYDNQASTKSLLTYIPWTTDTTTFNSSPDSYRSAVIGGSQKTYMQKAFTVPANKTSVSVNLQDKVSSEQSGSMNDYYYLNIYSDNVWQWNDYWWGEWDWKAFSAGFSVTSGQTLLLQWYYAKNATVDQGSDAAWVDDVKVDFWPGASSEQGIWTADKARDSDSVSADSRWSSADTVGTTGTFPNRTFTTPQWLAIDLGSSTTETQATIVWEAHATTFDVEGSTDGITWTKYATGVTGTSGSQVVVLNPSGVSVRYVRVYCYGTTGTNGVSIYELSLQDML